MIRTIRVFVVALALIVLAGAPISGKAWDEPLRGTWLADSPGNGVTVVADGNRVAEIVVSAQEHTAVKQAARFLAQDIAKISGVKPEIVDTPSDANMSRIFVSTLGVGVVPKEIDAAALAGQWEAFHIRTIGTDLYLVGSNFRGTAFSVYTLSERLGIDPLYLWTGYQPEQHNPLRVKKIDYLSPSPTFKYRGLFHDDEDILPRPIDPKSGYPTLRGQVPTEWYARYFETALRLKMNMVAPFVRVSRSFEVQQMASDWGLFYTSHHYDILLSNPYGYTNYGLAQKRGVSGGFDWFNNRNGMVEYWKGGVLENRTLDAIWPVGMRGTEDHPYTFPPNITDEEKLKVYQQIIDLQVAMTKELLPPEKEPIFHFTMYNEMLDYYRRGGLRLPDDVILVWDDDGDGNMRALPNEADLQLNSKHGVYYHLAFLGRTSKQTVHTVNPMRIEYQFRNIVKAGANEFMLLNVSELREHIMETRMIADIVWDAAGTLGESGATTRYVNWWSREYFGAAAEDAARSYWDYYRMIDAYDSIWYGASHISGLVEALRNKFAGKPYSQVSQATYANLTDRSNLYARALDNFDRASEKMDPQQKQFFFEHVAFGMLIDYRAVQTAVGLMDALRESNLDKAFEMCLQAFAHLEQLEAEIKKAERTPFEDWYRPTWIRLDDPSNKWSLMNPHRSYDVVRDFLFDIGGFGISSPTAGSRLLGDSSISFTTTNPRLQIKEVKIGVDDAELYVGNAIPQTFSFDTMQFADGPHTLNVRGVTDDPHLTVNVRVPIFVNNWWTVNDVLKAPQSSWFGETRFEQTSSRSSGWLYAIDDTDTFFKDESRLVRAQNTSEQLTWKTPQLRDWQVTLYARSKDISNTLRLAVSSDGEAWKEVPYSVAVADTRGAWMKLVVTGAVDANQNAAYFRLSLLESELSTDALQIGGVELRGRN